MARPRFVNATQRALSVTRSRIRHDMMKIALTHRGCAQARGCGCFVDKALAVLAKTEADIFQIEIDSYADPKTPRRVVQPDNTIGSEDPLLEESK